MEKFVVTFSFTDGKTNQKKSFIIIDKNVDDFGESTQSILKVALDELKNCDDVVIDLIGNINIEVL